MWKQVIQLQGSKYHKHIKKPPSIYSNKFIESIIIRIWKQYIPLDILPPVVSVKSTVTDGISKSGVSDKIIRWPDPASTEPDDPEK